MKTTLILGCLLAIGCGTSEPVSCALQKETLKARIVAACEAQSEIQTRRGSKPAKLLYDCVAHYQVGPSDLERLGSCQ